MKTITDYTMDNGGGGCQESGGEAGKRRSSPDRDVV
jgi:hypothetical protein